MYIQIIKFDSCVPYGICTWPLTMGAFYEEIRLKSWRSTQLSSTLGWNLNMPHYITSMTWILQNYLSLTVSCPFIFPSVHTSKLLWRLMYMYWSCLYIDYYSALTGHYKAVFNLLRLSRPETIASRLSFENTMYIYKKWPPRRWHRNFLSHNEGSHVVLRQNLAGISKLLNQNRLSGLKRSKFIRWNNFIICLVGAILFPFVLEYLDCLCLGAILTVYW